MINIRVEDLGDSSKKAIETLQRIKREFPDITEMIIRRWCEGVIKIAQKEYLNAPTSDMSRLHRVTGKLAASMQYWMVGKDTGDVGSNLIYARIQHEGGIISPGARGFLAWPIMTGVYITRTGALRKKPTKAVAGYAFTTRPVTIPARPYIKPSIHDYFARGIGEKEAERVLEQEIKKRAENGV